MSNNGGIWLNKFISESGFCSRRGAEKFIDDGLVKINGVIAGKVQQVMPNDVVHVDGLLIEHRKATDIVFIALNKPVGVVSSTEKKIKNNIVDFVDHEVRIFPIGRLDKDSQGLIFMTNNGDMVNKILRAGNNHEKEYIVTVDKPLTEKVLANMARGVPMLGTITKKCLIVQESKFVFKIVLVQGLNRQIRRMCSHFGYEVVKLERVRIMNITLKGLPPGKWRNLTKKEMDDLQKLTKESTSDHPTEIEITDTVKSTEKTPSKKAKETVKLKNTSPKKHRSPIEDKFQKGATKDKRSNSSNKTEKIEKKDNIVKSKHHAKPESVGTNKKSTGKEKVDSNVSNTSKSKPPAKKTGAYKAFRNARVKR